MNRTGGTSSCGRSGGLRRRDFLGLVAGACVAGVARGADPTPARPNIVCILIDDMGWTDAECCGSTYYQTPSLNALAAQGMRFTSAYAACAVCSPTRAAIMTGKAPARLHITDWIPGEGVPAGKHRFTLPDWQKQLPLEEVTLAEALKKLGYATGHVGKWHLGGPEFSPEHQGFDLNKGGCHLGHPPSYFWPYSGKGGKGIPGLAEAGGAEGEYLTDRLTNEALKFIEAHKDVPFYLNLDHYAVHAPLQGKKELIDEAADRQPANGQGNRTYAAMIRSMDQSVGRVMKKLDELHLAERTIVVFTSDNGGAVHFGQPPATSNKPLRLGKGYAYEGGLRVPLLIKAPGHTRPGSVCDTPVISMDFFPTLLELAGADRAAAASAVDGASIVPLLRGEPNTPHAELFWHYPHYWHGGKVSPYSVARVGDWKLIRFYESDCEELYHLKDDLSEARNLAQKEPAKRKELAGRLDAWLREVGAQMPAPKA